MIQVILTANLQERNNCKTVMKTKQDPSDVHGCATGMGIIEASYKG